MKQNGNFGFTNLVQLSVLLDCLMSLAHVGLAQERPRSFFAGGQQSGAFSVAEHELNDVTCLHPFVSECDIFPALR